MNRTKIIFGLLPIVFSLHAQIWQKKNVGNNVYVSFPTEVKYEMKSSNGKYVGRYSSKSENCLFMVLVMSDVIPDYPNFVNLNKSDQNNIITILLDNFCKGKLMYSNSHSEVVNTKIDNCLARQLSYTAINPATGEAGKRFSKSFVVANKLFSFECWYLSDSSTSNLEMVDFYNSIQIK
ncbi:MAG: hypothetical protein PHR83_13925 [Paludibacter sp.]|nr:hypothetical protein [Paludibacter sp.]